MSNGFFNFEYPNNEPVYSYKSGSLEREEVLDTYKKMFSEVIEVPQYIGKQKVFSGKKIAMTPPQNHKHIVGYYHEGDEKDVKNAIDSALETRSSWQSLDWHDRAAIFMKAARLISGPFRAKINAATMIGQSKNVFQAEIDAACEFADFLRYNVYFMQQIYADQPHSSEDVWNRMEYRPLEGFTYAVTPFNFTAIAANLPASMAMMGNVVVWKPSLSQIYSAEVIMEIFEKAGLPKGVINMVITDPKKTTDIVFSHPDFCALHFTGSTEVFKNLWKQAGENIHLYKNYPRIVGETGGKDFVLAHPSANVDELVAGLCRGAFEYQGQKCSAASRTYIPKSIWSEVKEKLVSEVKTMKMGSPEDFSNFINAVIHKGSFDRITGYIDRAKKSNEVEVLVGGSYDDSVGYFVEPTILLTTNPKYESMVEEIFGPVLTVYVYEDENWEDTLEIVDSTSAYALTGSIYAEDRSIVKEVTEKLQNAAGNFYVNDKPTGAFVGQQPFGGSRASGTNDKSGSYINLLKWVSPRTIKENLLPITDYRYPFLEE